MACSGKYCWRLKKYGTLKPLRKIKKLRLLLFLSSSSVSYFRALCKGMLNLSVNNYVSFDIKPVFMLRFHSVSRLIVQLCKGIGSRPGASKYFMTQGQTP